MDRSAVTVRPGDRVGRIGRVFAPPSAAVAIIDHLSVDRGNEYLLRELDRLGPRAITIGLIDFRNIRTFRIGHHPEAVLRFKTRWIFPLQRIGRLLLFVENYRRQVSLRHLASRQKHRKIGFSRPATYPHHAVRLDACGQKAGSHQNENCRNARIGKFHVSDHSLKRSIPAEAHQKPQHIPEEQGHACEKRQGSGHMLTRFVTVNQIAGIIENAARSENNHRSRKP